MFLCEDSTATEALATVNVGLALGQSVCSHL